MRKIRLAITVIDWIGAVECWGVFFLRLLGLVIAVGAGDDVFGGGGGGEGDGLGSGRLVRMGRGEGLGGGLGLKFISSSTFSDSLIIVNTSVIIY